MSDSTSNLSPLFDALRDGDAAARAKLLARYQSWLQLLARMQIDGRFRGKFDASDIVQQTLLEACRDLPKFRGGTEGELLAWLRQVLAHVLGHEFRRYAGTQQRDVGREVSLEQSLAQSSQRLGDMLAAPGSSPSQQAVRHEQEVLLAEVLARLPDDYREVLILRNLEGLSHEEIAVRMGRGVGAVRMLWVRALRGCGRKPLAEGSAYATCRRGRVHRPVRPARRAWLVTGGCAPASNALGCPSPACSATASNCSMASANRPCFSKVAALRRVIFSFQEASTFVFSPWPVYPISNGQVALENQTSVTRLTSGPTISNPSQPE